MRVGDDSAAYAVNWRVVLVADALVGVVVVIAGVVALLAWNAVVGAMLILVGAVYVGLIGARARRWSRLRRSGPT